MALTAGKHNPLEPEFRLEETDRRTKVGRVLMVVIAAVVLAVLWFSSVG